MAGANGVAGHSYIEEGRFMIGKIIKIGLATVALAGGVAGLVWWRRTDPSAIEGKDEQGK